MPAPATVTDFLELSLRSGLLEKDLLDTAVESLRSSGAVFDTPQQVADELIKQGLLTSFQAEKLLSGKWRGFVVGEKYRLLERLGAGGMGAVYLCEHIFMHRRVALKFLPPTFAEDPASLARFYREARAVAQLDHPNIIRAHDIDRDETDPTKKLHFLVMEFIDGVNLHDFVKNNGVLSPLRAAHYIRQAALGLQHAHEAGLVHRDIKPGNLLLDRQGVVKILDMGLARFFDDDGTAFAKEFEHGYVIGTADYLAPEQTLDSRVDIRADIYSLGGTMYYFLVGKSPFQEGSVPQKMIWHQVRKPRSVKHYRQDVPDALLEVMDTMMAKEPSKRYQTPLELVRALNPMIPEMPSPPTAEEMPPQVRVGTKQSGEISTLTANVRTPGSMPQINPGSAKILPRSS